MKNKLEMDMLEFQKSAMNNLEINKLGTNKMEMINWEWKIANQHIWINKTAIKKLGTNNLGTN